MKTSSHSTTLHSTLARIGCSIGLVLGCLFVTGCPASKQTNGSTTDNTTQPAPKTDTVVIRGSNTIGEELAPHLISVFKRANAGINFDLESKATGYGMAALRIGQCDIAAASRAAIQIDLDLAKENGLEMNDYLLGYYSVAVVVAAGNPVSNLTKDQVRDIFTGKITNWKEVGGADGEIHVHARDPISGTHLGFKEAAMNNDAYAAHIKTATNYAALVAAVGKDANGIGYSSLDLANTAGAKAVTIDGVAANSANVQSGKYPYARALRYYTNKAKESDATKKFIEFTLSGAGQKAVEQMGFTPKS
jgi:phosphate transport system substrate-binding protein